MASSYAALVSLMNLLIRIQHPSSPDCFHTSQTQSLLDKVNFLVDALESYSHKISKDLQTKITTTVFAAEDRIESRFLEIQQNTNLKVSITCLLPEDLDRAIKDMDYLIHDIVQANEKNDEQDQLTRTSVPVRSPPVVARDDAIEMVGFEEEKNSLMALLTSRESSRQIIPVVGMGGLGKTTLATNVYSSSHVKSQFDIKAWVTISQLYAAKTIFISLLRDIGVKTDSIREEHLGDALHKALWGRTYLIVIDDIWDVAAWDELNRFCPDNNNGSRILLTTRISDVADRVGSCSPFELQLLDSDRSWKVLSRKVFGQEDCPPELENCGKEIAKNCKGLPLAIAVIGGLLNVSNRTRENWELVERNIKSILNVGDNEHCMKILSLSYHQLPLHLKPCFLYLASFTEDEEIRVSNVTKLWDADGFLKPVEGKAMCDVVLDYLIDLVSRNLIMVKKRKVRSGAMKSFILHDLVRDLCIKEAHDHTEMCLSQSPTTKEGQCRLVSRNGRMSYLDMHRKEKPRSSIRFPYDGISKQNISSACLLRIVASTWDNYSRERCFDQFVNARFLEISTLSHLLSDWDSISSLLNLETFIADVEENHSMDYALHCEFWNLRRIRHLIFSEIVLFPNPPSAPDVMLENLETFTNVVIRSEEVLHRIPNVKKLKVVYFQIENENQHDEKLVTSLMPRFDHLDKLDTLMFIQMGCLGLGNNTFPSNLRKLTLGGTEISWVSMTIIGSLPNLEYLVLLGEAFVGKEWETIEGEFQSLKCLTIGASKLVAWTVEDCSHFPCLEHLSLHGMEELEEIPQVFAELMTLTSIKLEECSKSSAISAKQILDEKQSMAIYDLTVEVLLSHSDMEKLEVELEGLPNDHFHLLKKQERRY